LGQQDTGNKIRMHVSLCSVLLLSLVIIQTHGYPEPGRRGGGSRGGRGSSWGGSNSRRNSGNYGQNKNYGGNYYGGKKSGGMKKTLKKAAVIGAVAYGSYQLGKMTGRWGSYHHGGHWGHQDYNRWREKDGMLCRDNKDCKWIDPRLFCTDYDLDFDIDRGWFGGDYLSVRGECECPRGSRWDNYELECRERFMGALGGVGFAVILVLMCACCGGGCLGAYCFYKRR